MKWSAQWIAPIQPMGDTAPCFEKRFTLCQRAVRAELYATAMGVYEATLNGARVSDYVLAPGYTSYAHRLQFQRYDVTHMLRNKNVLCITVGKGWYRGRFPGWMRSGMPSAAMQLPAGLLAELRIVLENGTSVIYATDETWRVKESPVRFSEIYDGEIYDATFVPRQSSGVYRLDGPDHTLIWQEGEFIREQEHLHPRAMIITPKGEIIIDFGQNLAGYVMFTATAKEGEVLDLSFAEVLDCKGNFYTDNYRSAKAVYRYTCKRGAQTYKPHFTFWGFRYIRVNAFPGGLEKVEPSVFEAIAVHSDMKRTGTLITGNSLLNQLYSNAVWGQKGNFLDIPTDCPQRDERLGWTGDAQIFCRTACLNFDAETFFSKWLSDLAAVQYENGGVPLTVPDVMNKKQSSAAWGDAATICPWEVYMTYGNPNILRRQYKSMRRWVDFITRTTKKESLWIGGTHFGDWLEPASPDGSRKVSSRNDLIATAFYAYSVDLLMRAGRVLNENVTAYERLYESIVKAFRKAFPIYETQTECVLALHFGLAKDTRAAADRLANMIRRAGTSPQTGFVGTPYLLYALSSHGHTKLAYDLLLRTECPSWLYQVIKGATTIWEHWDGQREDGSFRNADMNSFNHCAYGAVISWVYEVAAGIRPLEAGYAKALISPHPDMRLGWLSAAINTRCGRIVSEWKHTEGCWRYEITTPVESTIVIDGKTYTVGPGRYCFFTRISDS